MENLDTGKMQLKVCVRLRPTPEDCPSLVHADHRVLYMKDPLRGHNSEFVFDNIFGPDAKQDAVFQEVGMPLVEHVMQGYNACCLAYGHTGSGKTYTMLGREPSTTSDGQVPLDRNEYGIIPRVCEMIAKAASKSNRKADQTGANANCNVVRIKLFVSFLEVYMENVRDLGAGAQAYLKLQAARPRGSDGYGHGYSHHGASSITLRSFPSSDGGPPAPGPSRPTATALREPTDYARTCLDVMEDAYGTTFVKDLTFIEVTDAEDMLSILQAGYAVRPSCPLDVSSRAHTVFSISVVTYRGEEQPVTGRLNLVDLAGSEKQSRGGPEGHRLREASAVGKSLAALSKVVVSLSQQSIGGYAPSRAASLASASSGTPGPAPPHVPYRDTKLTRVLKNSVCGNAMLTLVACVYPIFDEVDESLATLQYATKVLTNTTAPHVNLLAPPGTLGFVTASTDLAVVEELQAQVTALKDELEVTHAHYQKLIENIAGPSWRTDPGPVERAGGGSGVAATGGGFAGPAGAAAAAAAAANSIPFRSQGAAADLGSFAAALATLGKPGSGNAPGAAAAGGGSLGPLTKVSTAHPVEERRRSQVDEVLRPPRGVTSDGRAAAVAGGGHSAAVGSVGAKGGAGVGGTVSSPGGTGGGANANARVSVLEAQIRKLESQLSQARAAAQQYEERLMARKEEMEQARERMAGKEHAQFAEIKKLRGQVAELNKALDAERTESAHKLDEAKRRSDEESARLMRDIDTLRNQLTQVTGTVSSLVEKHSAAITAEKRQREAVKRQATQLLQQQFTRGTEEHRAQLENLKQQSTYFLSKRVEELAELKHQLDEAKAAHATEKDVLLAELDYLAAYSERVTELVRRMETGVVPVTERGNGVKVFRLPQRERPPRLDGNRLAVLKERAADLHERLVALSTAAGSGGTLSGGPSAHSLHGTTPSAAAATTLSAPPTVANASANPTFGGWVGAAGAGSQTSPARGASNMLGTVVVHSANSQNPLGSSVDLDELRAQVEAELKAHVTAQVVGDLRSEKTVEYIRELETAVGRYRQELQSEKKRSAEMAVALRSVQRQHQRPQSPINKAIAAHTPAGTIKLVPSWGLGHTTPRGGVGSVSGGTSGGGGGGVTSRPATAGLVPLAELSASTNGRASAPAATRRPSTTMASLTTSFRENSVAIP